MHAGPEWEIFFAWQSLVAPRVPSAGSDLDVLPLVLITLCSLGKHRLALPISEDQLLCLMYIKNSSTISQCLHILVCFKKKSSSDCFPICNEALF